MTVEIPDIPTGITLATIAGLIFALGGYVVYIRSLGKRIGGLEGKVDELVISVATLIGAHTTRVTLSDKLRLVVQDDGLTK